MKNYKWIAFLAVTLSLFVSVMSMGAILISLKDISDSFNTPIHQVSWIVIVHLLTVTAILLPAGNIADRFGRKNVHIFGILIFIIGTLIGVFANTFEILIFSRIIMAIGKSQASIKVNKLAIKFGKINVVQDGKLYPSYSEEETTEYMKNSDIEINVSIGTGNKNFTVYTMDLTKKYIEINADYRS